MTALGHLVVLRSTLQAQLVNVDAAIAALSGEEEAPATPDCKHPQRELLTNMGETPRWRCKDCGAEFTEEASW